MPLDFDPTMLPPPPLDYDPHRHSAFIEGRIRYLWDYEQGNHFVKHRYDAYTYASTDEDNSWSKMDNADKYATEAEDFTFYPPPETQTIKPTEQPEKSIDNSQGIPRHIKKYRNNPYI